MEKLHKRLDFAKIAAVNAGNLLLEHFGKITAFEHKGVVNLVTEADKASEKLIIDQIAENFPEDLILAEETGDHPGDSDFKWIIDPLDGTTNFIHTYPVFCVSIGIEFNLSAAAGVVYCPVSKELFFAEKGHGAFLNNRQIAVSKVEKLSSALLATGFPYYRREQADRLIEKVKRAIMNAHGIRRSGVASYDLCCVASGRIDGFWEEGLKPWDIAAGSLIIMEAGGALSDFSKDEFSVYGNEILASNGIIHAELARVMFDR
jgi:myo-inositol-1(or 4)-monophosphatase